MRGSTYDNEFPTQDRVTVCKLPVRTAEEPKGEDKGEEDDQEHNVRPQRAHEVDQT